MVGQVTYYPGIGAVQWDPVEVIADGDWILTIVQGWGLVSMEKRRR